MNTPAEERPEWRSSLVRGLQIGLRGRVTLAVAAVGLLLSVVLSLTTVTVARNTLLATREDALTQRAAANAETIRGGLDNAEAADLQTLLSSLPDGGTPSLITAGPDGEPVQVSIDSRFGIDTLPDALLDRVVQQRQSAIMRFESSGEPGVVAVAQGPPNPKAIHTLTTTWQRFEVPITLPDVSAIKITPGHYTGLGFDMITRAAPTIDIANVEAWAMDR